MKNPKCASCGSSRVAKSPSGRHLICLECQRIVLREDIVRPVRRRGIGAAARARKAESTSESAL